MAVEHIRLYAENIVDTIRDSLVILDQEMHVVYANRSFYKNFAVTPEETEGKRIYDLGNGQWNIPSLRHLLEKIIPEQQVFYGFQVKHRFETIGEKVMLLNARRLLREAEKPALILLAIEDITSQYEAERKFEIFVEKINSIIIGFNREGIITFFNRFSEKLFGYSREEVIGTKKFIGTIIPELDSSGNDNTQIEKEIFINPDKYYANENEGVCKDGNKMLFTWSAKALRNESGEVYEILIDGNYSPYVTTRKEIEKVRDQLREERELLETIIDSIPVMITMYDPELEKVRINKEFERITGWTQDDVTHQDIMVLVYPDPEYRSMAAAYMRSLEPGFRDFKIKNSMGEDIETSWANVKIRDGRQVGIGIDISDRVMAQKRIAIAAEQFRRITSSNIIGVVIADETGKIFNANDCFLNLLGFDRVDLEKKEISWKSITPPEYAPLDDKAIKELQEKGVAAPYEKEYIRKDGSRVWVMLADTVLPGPERNIFTFVLDVTDRRHALDEAVKRRAEIEAVLNSLPDGFAVYNKEGKIIQFNKRAETMMGLTKNMQRLTYEEHIRQMNPLTADGQVFPIEQLPSSRALHGEVVRDTIIHFQLQERDIWVSESASPISIDSNLIGAVMEFTDITNLHTLQEQLANERNFVTAVLQTSGALITVIDNDGRIIRFNRACEKLTGYSLHEVYKRPVFDLVPEDELEDIKMVFRRLFEGESPVEHENHWVTRSGSKHYIRWQNSILYNSRGQVEFSIATGIDISDRKQLETELNLRAEELAIVNRDLESFSYSVSHDLRGPLVAIDGFTNFLIEDYMEQLDEDGRDYLQRIKMNVKKSQKLIDDILNLSRVGRYEIKREAIDLSLIVKTFLNDLASQERQRTVQCVIQEHVFANADPRMVHIALENLLRNAWKFSEKEKNARIEFGVIRENGMPVYFVRDNGVGFDMKFAQDIFKPFKRVHTEKEFSGTGIGLSIVQRVVNRHGGRVWASGEVAKGATFYFTLE